MNGQQIIMLLSQLMKNSEPGIFDYDETDSKWHREENIDVLKKFCPEGFPMAEAYGHFIIGNAAESNYIGIPGRFLSSEQPARGGTGFTLWQPLRGGKEYFESLNTIGDEADLIYGYWIARIDPKTLQISEV